MTLTDEQKSLLGFALACYLEDAERNLKKEAKKNPSHDFTLARKQLKRIEMLTYTEVIPASWCGPRPTDWPSE